MTASVLVRQTDSVIGDQRGAFPSTDSGATLLMAAARRRVPLLVAIGFAAIRRPTSRIIACGGRRLGGVVTLTDRSAPSLEQLDRTPHRCPLCEQLGPYAFAPITDGGGMAGDRLSNIPPGRYFHPVDARRDWRLHRGPACYFGFVRSTDIATARSPGPPRAAEPPRPASISSSKKTCSRRARFVRLSPPSSADRGSDPHCSISSAAVSQHPGVGKPANRLRPAKTASSFPHTLGRAVISPIDGLRGMTVRRRIATSTLTHDTSAHPRLRIAPVRGPPATRLDHPVNRRRRASDRSGAAASRCRRWPIRSPAAQILLIGVSIHSASRARRVGRPGRDAGACAQQAGATTWQ